MVVRYDGEGVYVGQDLKKSREMRERKRERRERREERERVMAKRRRKGSWKEGGRREGKNFVALAAVAKWLSSKVSAVPAA